LIEERDSAIKNMRNAEAYMDAALTENIKLYEALRHHAIRANYPDYWCAECKRSGALRPGIDSNWRPGEPEKHAPGCLAAPKSKGEA